MAKRPWTNSRSEVNTPSGRGPAMSFKLSMYLPAVNSVKMVGEKEGEEGRKQDVYKGRRKRGVYV